MRSGQSSLSNQRVLVWFGLVRVYFRLILRIGLLCLEEETGGSFQ
jgi:hypothetical protein